MTTSYWLTNILVSLLALTALVALRTAPPRPKMWVCVVAAAAWGFPWPIVSSLWQSSDLFVRYVRFDALQSLPLPADALSSAVAASSVPWDWLFIALTAAGLLLFATRIYSHHRGQRALMKNAESVPDAWVRAGFPDVSLPIRVVDDLENAFVSGYWHPRIWLGRSQFTSPALTSILQHELVHIRQHDNFTLMFVTLLSDLFWWNPLVRTLTRLARRYLELSCDHVCQKLSPEYRENLASELLNREYRSFDSRLVSPISLGQKFNVYRIRHLAKGTSMKLRHFFCFGFLAIASLLLVSNIAASKSADSERQIVTDLTVKIVTTESDGAKSTRSVETQFIGEPEVEKFLRFAEAANVTVDSHMANDLLRIIVLESDNIAETEKVLAAFQGTGLQNIYDFMITRDNGRHIFLDVIFQPPDSTPFEVSLAPNVGEWTGVTVGDYLLRIKPDLAGSRGDESVLLSAEISRIEQSAFTLISTPSLTTTFGKSALIEVGHQVGDEESILSVTLLPRRTF